MKRFYLVIFVLLISVAFSNFSCNSISQTGKKGDEFYAYLKNGEYDMIIDLLDEQAINEHPKEKWIALLESRSQYWGKPVSYTNTGFHSETADGYTITRLDYIVDNTNGKVYERINFIERGEDLKILAYEYNPDKNKLRSN